MNICTIRELADITEAVEHTTGQDASLYVRNTMYGEGHYWFRHGDLFVHCERIGIHKYALHTFGVSRDSMRYKIKFFVSIGCWMMDNTDCTTLVVFVPETHLRLRILVNKIIEPTCYMPCGAGPEEGEYMFVFDLDNREDIERRFLCHKQ